MKVKIVVGLMLAAIIANSAAAAKQYTCEQMAERLNKKWMVGSNRFDAGGKTGQEAREALGEWLADNGILTTKCTPFGYPDVEGPCLDGVLMDHVAASWVGLTDRAKELVESNQLMAFPVFPNPGIGLIFNTSSAQVEVTCSFASDGATQYRMGEGCGPLKSDYYFGKDSKRDIIEQYVKDKEENVKNLTNIMQVRNVIREYNDSMSTWTLKEWQDTGRTWEEFTCPEWYEKEGNWSGFTPKDTSSMEACKAYTKKPPNAIWDSEVTHIGNALYYLKMGSWDDPLEKVLGHPTCKYSPPPCIYSATCEGWSVCWAGACSWSAEDFQNAMDMWFELRSKANPRMFQNNEVVLNLEANDAGGVEAIYAYSSEALKAKKWGDPYLGPYLEQLAPDDYPLPANISDYMNYAAKQLAENYYGGIPVVTIYPTRENALAGTMFRCETN